MASNYYTVESEITSFGGKLLKLSHHSRKTNTQMAVNIYLPKQYYDSTIAKIPVLLYLSGLTCTPQNASEKAFWQPYANQYGFAVVFPDTSPRGTSIKGQDDSYDFGSGAGFYVDATEPQWSENFNMYSYVNDELLSTLPADFQKLDLDTVSITGHSMGGYGALMFFLKNPSKYKSVSAFAPIANPMNCPWGEKCFGGYLGSDKSKWAEYDPCELIKSYEGPSDSSILVHVGGGDPFYYRDHQLLPENFVKAVENSPFKGKLSMNIVDGYDHSYYFISSFTGDHAKHHAKYLGLIN